MLKSGETVEIINLSKGEAGFAEEIKKMGGQGILECVQCGKCAATCPLALAGFPFFNKRVIHAILNGLKEVLLNDVSIWACQSCNRCTETCPRRADPFEIMMAMRRVAVQKYALPATAIKGIKSLYDVGHAVYLSEAGEPRKKLGLPEKPPTTAADPEALAEVQAILRKTSLATLGLIPMGEFGIFGI